MQLSQVPEELCSVDQGILQEYVGASIVAFLSQPEFAAALGIPSSAIHQAALNLLQKGNPEAEADITRVQNLTDQASGPAQPQQGLPSIIVAPLEALGSASQPFSLESLELVITHNCLHVACNNPSCALCTAAQDKICSRNFKKQYIMNEALKASCGAQLKVQAIDKTTKVPVPPEALTNIKIDAVLLNAKAVQQAQDAAAGQLSSQALDAAMVTKHQDKYVLDSVFGSLDKSATFASPQCTIEHNKDGRAVLSFSPGTSHVTLSHLLCTGSAEAIMSGQRPQFLMLLRAVNAETGDPVPEVAPLISEGFTVATIRVKTSKKIEIPHLMDPISKLNCVGRATQEKMKNLKQAAIDAGYEDLEFPLTRISTVAEFKQLVEWSQQNAVVDKLIKVLKLTRGWNEACEHAAMAVDSDSMLRVWYGGGGATSAALVFGAQRGAPLLDAGPIGVLEPPLASAEQGGSAKLWPIQLSVPSSPNQVSSPRTSTRAYSNGSAIQAPLCPSTDLISTAMRTWHAPLHPGWSVLPITTETLQQFSSIHGAMPLMLPKEMVAMLAPPQLMLTLPLPVMVPAVATSAGAGNGIEQQGMVVDLGVAKELKALPAVDAAAAASAFFGNKFSATAAAQPSMPHLDTFFPAVPSAELLAKTLSAFPPESFGAGLSGLLPAVDSEPGSVELLAGRKTRAESRLSPSHEQLHNNAVGEQGANDSNGPCQEKHATPGAITAVTPAPVPAAVLPPVPPLDRTVSNLNYTNGNVLGSLLAGLGQDASTANPEDSLLRLGSLTGSGSLLRGLTGDWGKLSSLSPSEWHQLVQLVEAPGVDGSLAGGAQAEAVPPPPPRRGAPTPVPPLFRDSDAAEGTDAQPREKLLPRRLSISSPSDDDSANAAAKREPKRRRVAGSGYGIL